MVQDFDNSSLNSAIRIKDIDKPLLVESIKRFDVVKLLFDNVNFIERTVYLNLDIERTRCLNFVKANEGRTIRGTIFKIKGNSIVVHLFQDLYGELNYLLKPSGNISN